MTRGARIRSLALAAVAGWLSGALITTPIQLVELVRNTAGDLRLMLVSLALGLILWGIWTLAIALVGLALAGLPIALWASPTWLLRHRVAIIAVSAAVGLAVPLAKFRAWDWLKPEPFYDLPLIAMYGIFASVFAAVTALLYLRMLQKKVPGGAGDSLR
jgi:hypothetical protein